MEMFLFKTIPVYWGCSSITNFFKQDGIITFDNIDDLIVKVNKLDESYYNDDESYYNDDDYLFGRPSHSKKGTEEEEDEQIGDSDMDNLLYLLRTMFRNKGIKDVYVEHEELDITISVTMGRKEKIESIQTEIDSAKAVNEGIDIKIDSVKGNVVKITKEIHHIDNNITIIKKQTDEKVNSVDTLTANELEQFFTKRYDKTSN